MPASNFDKLGRPEDFNRSVKSDEFESGIDYSAFTEDGDDTVVAGSAAPDSAGPDAAVTETPIADAVAADAAAESSAESSAVEPGSAPQTTDAPKAQVGAPQASPDSSTHSHDTGDFTDGLGENPSAVVAGSSPAKSASSATSTTSAKSGSSTSSGRPDNSANRGILKEDAPADKTGATSRVTDGDTTTKPQEELSEELPDPVAEALAGTGNLPPAQVRTVEEQRRVLREAQARLEARDDALSGPRTTAKVLQVLLAIFAPIVLLIAVIRAVASPLFLWIEYHRPWFPADEFGFTTEDRMVYGSYGMDYLFNFAPSRYLSDLTFPDGSPVFSAAEVSHMDDVKLVMLLTMLAGTLLAIACLVFLIVLSRTSKGAIRRSLFAASLWFLIVLIALAVLGALFWEQFFATFHSIFFADGTWTFHSSDTLIRLYPNQFWVDAGIVIAAVCLVVTIVTLVMTWPTKRRRARDAEAQLILLVRKNNWQNEDVTERNISLR